MTILCECGCGEPAPLSVEGRQLRWVPQHHRRKPPGWLPPVREEDRGFETPCLVALRENGEPYVQYAARSGFISHVRAWENVHGKTPKGFHVHHRCEQKPCIRVDHLELIPAREHGRRHKKHRLRVPFVKAMLEAGYSNRAIEWVSGLAGPSISNIRHGRAWAD